ncbi:hypothetical protein L596_025568 [Steinernema carpocapsae]|uniref:Uncharacterized protein n=1 Tax=Steinernema carpocapsae TaxID=34508 RepID=A0A4U5M868_STECR|nr:hypothetical protein L596_025568 [Steinernema carpocapsae]
MADRIGFFGSDSDPTERLTNSLLAARVPRVSKSRVSVFVGCSSPFAVISRGKWRRVQQFMISLKKSTDSMVSRMVSRSGSPSITHIGYSKTSSSSYLLLDPVRRNNKFVH